jgi:hypothetical protein
LHGAAATNLGAGSPCEGDTLLVDDGHLAGRQPGYGGSQQALDADHLLRAQGLPMPQGERHRRLGCGGCRLEQPLLRHRQVHPRLPHLREGQDGARQLTLQCALVVDLLRELGHAELGVVEQLEPDRAVQWQVLAHQLEPGGMHLRLVHQQAGAAGADAVRHLQLVQLAGQQGRVLRAQVREQNGSFRPP